MQTAAQAKKTEATFAAMWDKTGRQVAALENKLEEINMLRREMTALDAQLKARGRELFEVRRANDERFASKSQLEDVHLAVHKCAKVDDVAILRAEKDALAEASNATGAELQQLQSALAVLQDQAEAQTRKVGA
jgi:prefoldin subunit 5